MNRGQFEQEVYILEQVLEDLHDCAESAEAFVGEILSVPTSPEDMELQSDEIYNMLQAIHDETEALIHSHKLLRVADGFRRIISMRNWLQKAHEIRESLPKSCE